MIENVKGLLTHDGGKTIEKIIEELLKIKTGGLDAMCESRKQEMFKKIDLNVEEYYHKNMGEIIRKLHEEEDSLRDTKFANIKKLKDDNNNIMIISTMNNILPWQVVSLVVQYKVISKREEARGYDIYKETDEYKKKIIIK